MGVCTQMSRGLTGAQVCSCGHWRAMVGFKAGESSVTCVPVLAAGIGQGGGR